MKKISKLGLVLKCLQIVYVLARIAETVIPLVNMINNYPKYDAEQMVLKI